MAAAAEEEKEEEAEIFCPWVGLVEYLQSYRVSHVPNEDKFVLRKNQK